VGKSNITIFDSILYPIVGIGGFTINVRPSYLKYPDFVAVSEKKVNPD